MEIIDLNEVFNEYFYKKFTFLLDNKIIKEGRLKLFTMKSFNLKFFIQDENNDVKSLEIPYPFKLIKNDNGYIFDYRLKNLKVNNPSELVYELLNEENTKSRYFDKPLLLKIE